MEVEDPNMRKASHVGLWIIVIIIGAWLVWSGTHTKTMNKTDTFASGSKQTNNYRITRNYGLAFLDLAVLPFTFHGCTKNDKVEENPTQITNEVTDDKSLVNSVTADRS